MPSTPPGPSTRSNSRLGTGVPVSNPIGSYLTDSSYTPAFMFQLKILYSRIVWCNLLMCGTEGDGSRAYTLPSMENQNALIITKYLSISLIDEAHNYSLSIIYHLSCMVIWTYEINYTKSTMYIDLNLSNQLYNGLIII